MKNLFVLASIGLLFSWSLAAAEELEVFQSDFRNHEVRERLIKRIESGEENWENFIIIVKKQLIPFDRISPSAVANYLEAFANEGMLDVIPPEYFNDEEVATALEVVFQDLSNICKNPRVYGIYTEMSLE